MKRQGVRLHVELKDGQGSVVGGGPGSELGENGSSIFEVRVCDLGFRVV